MRGVAWRGGAWPAGSDRRAAGQRRRWAEATRRPRRGRRTARGRGRFRGGGGGRRTSWSTREVGEEGPDLLVHLSEITLQRRHTDHVTTETRRLHANTSSHAHTGSVRAPSRSTCWVSRHTHSHRFLAVELLEFGRVSVFGKSPSDGRFRIKSGSCDRRQNTSHGKMGKVSKSVIKRASHKL